MAWSRATRVALCALSLLLILLVSRHLYPRHPGPLRLPDAVLCGVKKAGTEALRSMLNSHPQLVVSRLVYFYDKNFHRGLEWYADTLPPVREDQLLIDRTPAYFTGGPGLPRRIWEARSDTLLLVVVRDPVDRFVSDYLHWEDKVAEEGGTFPYASFWDFAFSSSDPLTLRNHSDVETRLDRSCYSRHLRHWMDTFPPEQIMVVDGDRLRVSPWVELERVQGFLGVRQVIAERHFVLNRERGLYCWKVDTPTPICLGGKKGRTHPVLSGPELDILRGYFSDCNAEFRTQVAQLPDPPTFQWPY